MCTKFGVDRLTAQTFFVLERKQTDRQTRLNALPTIAAIRLAWVKRKTANIGNYI